MNLEDYKSKAHFKAPEGYFEQFENVLLHRLKQQETQKRTTLLYNIGYRLIAAALALLLLAGAYNLRSLLKETPKDYELSQSVTLDSLNFIHEPLLSDADLVEIMVQPEPAKHAERIIQVQNDHMKEESLISDEILIEEGLIEFNDPALHEFGIL
ncbi:MAG: hypothetical protein RLZZ370_532 [Bacteroidota bacterium]|jgi:hypothetical protein